MLRSVLAVFAGYIVMMMIVLGVVFSMVAFQGLDPDKMPPTNILLLLICASLLAAVAGGLTTAVVAKSKPFQHAVYLIVASLALGLVTMAMSEGKEPFWYQLTLQAVMVVGVLIGGQWIRIRREKQRYHR